MHGGNLATSSLTSSHRIPLDVGKRDRPTTELPQTNFCNNALQSSRLTHNNTKSIKN